MYGCAQASQAIRRAGAACLSTKSGVWDNLKAGVCAVVLEANVGDGDLVHAGWVLTIGGAAELDLVAGAVDDFTSAQCTATGVFDFFTTFANYIGWLTQATPLKESDFLSTATFTYDTASNSSSPTSTASSTGSQTSASATQTSQTNANTSKPNSAPASKLMGSAPVAVIAGVLLAASGLF
ncbi:hypothetical protein GQ54DRAFT_305210 [Martensiomyces pterosporus]|nr:hypothetical protein GQ54DRAFT_305210 [Martensiomyces pterosporus]